MNLLYLDLNAPDLCEDYSHTNPKRYGGNVVARHLMPYLNDNGHSMEIWADERCFDNVDLKYKKFCHGMPYESRQELMSGKPLKDFYEESDFDIVLHNFPRVTINTEGTKTKDLIWLVGYGEFVSPLNKRVIVYNSYQRPTCGENTTIYAARIGVPMPEFQEYPKEDFIFSCHRQELNFGSEVMMQLAHLYKFAYICAGPKGNWDMNKYIDNNYVTYLGVISERQKIEYFKRARASTYLHNWPTPFNLSAIQSLSYGTACIATPVGFWQSLISQGENGFIVNSAEDFGDTLQKVGAISQRTCYNTALDYSSDEMIKDYMNVFEEVLNDK